MLGRITDFASSPRGKWVTLLVWLVVAGLLISQLPRLSDVRENEAALFLPADAESTRAYEFARERFPSAGTPVLIVVREPGGLSPASFAAAAGLAGWLTGPGAPDNVIHVRAPDAGDPGSPSSRPTARPSTSSPTSPANPPSRPSSTPSTRSATARPRSTSPASRWPSAGPAGWSSTS